LPNDLTRYPERFAAGGKNAELRAASEQGAREDRAGLDQVLAVVQDDQTGALAQAMSKLVGLAPLSQSDCGGRCTGRPPCVAQAGSLYVPDTAGRSPPSQLDAQAGLANSGCTCQCQQPRGGQQSPSFSELATTSHELGASRGQPAHLIVTLALSMAWIFGLRVG